MSRPFDLEKAKQGAPLVTRDGRPAKLLALVEEAGDWPLAIHVGGEKRITTYKASGRFTETGYESNYDLFLADPPKVKKSGWVALCKMDEYPMGVGGNAPRPTKEDAIRCLGDKGHKVLAVVEIHWEEEAP